VCVCVCAPPPPPPPHSPPPPPLLLLLQEKEQESLQRDVVRELDRFRAEEMSRVERKIEESREGIRREMEILYARNLQARIVS